MTAASAPPLSRPEHFEKIPSPTRKGRSSKVKPVPNLGQASRDKTADRPAGSGWEKQAAVKNTQGLLQPEDSPSVQQSNDDPAPVAAPGQGVQPGSCKGVKTQPNLNKATRSIYSQPRATKEPVESGSSPSADPEPTAPEHVLPVKTSAAALDEIREHPVSQGHTSQTSGKLEETNVHHSQTAASSPGTGSGPDSASGEPQGTQKEQVPQPPVKSRFQKVKAKPNLAQAMRSARSRPQVPKTSEQNVSSPALGAESHQGPVAELTEKHLSDTASTELKSALGVEATEVSSTPVEMDGEQTAHIQAGTGSDPDLNPVGESHASQTEASLKPPARSRFQKIKPKPNVALTSRSSRPKPKVGSCNVHEVHRVELETKPATVFPPENAASTSDSVLSSAAVAPPASQENLKEMDVGAFGQVGSSAKVAEIPVPVQAAAADSAEELGSQEKGEKSSSVCKTIRREKVKAKPCLAARKAASTTAACEVPDQGIAEEAEQMEKQPPSGQSQTEPTAPAAFPEVEQKPGESSAVEQRTDVESDQVSRRNLPPRRHYSRVKPSLGSCTRTRSLGQQPKVSVLRLAEDHSQQVATVCGSLQKTEAVGSGAQLESETCSSLKSSESGIKSDAPETPGTCQVSCVANIQSGDAVQPLENSRYDVSLT